MGIARLQRKDETELKKVRERWQIGSRWRFKAITLLNDKPAYIHTSCRIAIDLRKSQAQALLQSTSFPQTPVPTVTIADVLQLTQMQHFDLMAIVAKVLDERSSRAGMNIADVRLVDGSKDNDSNTTEYASLPLTLFFKDAAELASFKEYVGKTPLTSHTCVAHQCGMQVSRCPFGPGACFATQPSAELLQSMLPCR